MHLPQKLRPQGQSFAEIPNAIELSGLSPVSVATTQQKRASARLGIGLACQKS